jgi:hypothetical protein
MKSTTKHDSTRYVCVGSVRGSCGIAHRSLDAAIKCLDDDGRWCRRQGGYSDRHIEHIDGTQLSESDFLYVQHKGST